MISNEKEPLVESATKGNVYAIPRIVTDVNSCYFYHTMDIPGYGTVKGEWNLHPNVKDYYGNVDFIGKRVLEIGTSSGFGCFTMEKWGAEVTAFDLSPVYSWDIVPFHGIDYRQIIWNMKQWIEKVNNAFWFCHSAFKSRARVVYGTERRIPGAGHGRK